MSLFSLLDCGLHFIISLRDFSSLALSFALVQAPALMSRRNGGQSLRGGSCKKIAVAISESMKMYEKLRKTMKTKKAL
jgi:hypothetical protein